MLAWAPFVPAVTGLQLKLVSVLVAVGVVSVTPVPGVSAYTVTVSPDATATTLSRAVLLRFRLIAAARLVALVPTVVEISKSTPVFEVDEEVSVRATAVPPVGVMVMVAVLPAAGSALKVPTTLARVFPVDALTGNTAKSAVQLGDAFTLKEYLAGHIPSATPPAPSATAQSVSILLLNLLGRHSLRGICRSRTKPESAGAFPCTSHCA